MRSIGPAILGLAVLASACTTAPAPSLTPDQLAGSWRVYGLNGGGVSSFKVTISFEEDAVGHASCNDYRFPYRLDGRRLEFAGAVTMTTDRVCDLEALKTEERFLATLGEVDHVGITSSGSLVLYADQGRIVARRS